jgi:hypothetical protein
VAWLQAAGWELKLQKPARITGPVQVSVAAGRPDRRKRDLDKHRHQGGAEFAHLPPGHLEKSSW